MSSERKIKNVIFDLDGTIIDSANGINMAFNKAYSELYNSADVFDIKDLVGPPIKDIFVKTCKEKDVNKVASFIKMFQEKYDLTYYSDCTLYYGILSLLEFLKDTNIDCFIATNKRLTPTTLILNHLNIDVYFKNIYTIDSTQNNYINKTEMVRAVLNREGLIASETILIGDTDHDQVAAQANNIEFIYADHGYGNLINVEKELKKYLKSNSYISLIE